MDLLADALRAVGNARPDAARALLGLALALLAAGQVMYIHGSGAWVTADSTDPASRHASQPCTCVCVLRDDPHSRRLERTCSLTGQVTGLRVCMRNGAANATQAHMRISGVSRAFQKASERGRSLA